MQETQQSCGAAKTVFTILLGGPICVTERLRKQVSHSVVIAADSGIRHSLPLGVVPQLWVGDFDSCDAHLQERYASVERKSFSTNKDKIDGQLALEAALEAGAEEVILCGAFGGPRLDHVLAHMMMAVATQEKGKKTWLTSGTQEGYPILGGQKARFCFAKRTPFSIIGLSTLQELSITGAQWNLEKACIGFGSTHTLSNCAFGTIDIGLRSGRGILLADMEL